MPLVSRNRTTCSRVARGVVSVGKKMNNCKSNLVAIFSMGIDADIRCTDIERFPGREKHADLFPERERCQGGPRAPFDAFPDRFLVRLEENHDTLRRSRSTLTGSVTAPPPVLITASSGPIEAMTWRSRSRKYASPWVRIISWIVIPEASSICMSVSVNGRLSRCERTRPTSVFPVPRNPQRTILIRDPPLRDGPRSPGRICSRSRPAGSSRRRCQARARQSSWQSGGHSADRSCPRGAVTGES